MGRDIKKLALNWCQNKKGEIPDKEYYCATRDIFQARLSKMLAELLAGKKIAEQKAYIITAIAGEIGNNSFDHNLGAWPDVMGIFFAHQLNDDNITLVLADRGRGVLNTLKKVKPTLSSHKEALMTAFSERISGRAPEARGNGLKFVRENIKDRKMHLVFVSGNARAKLNEEMEIIETKEKIIGCLAIITL
ncbi:hypothetical protein HY798_00180 [Candidatus Falkowbacteria bacterium]|nr:hypothetical protein [Candidatus Falkowbacteria bacterium]